MSGGALDALKLAAARDIESGAPWLVDRLHGGDSLYPRVLSTHQLFRHLVSRSRGRMELHFQPRRPPGGSDPSRRSPE